MWYRSLMLAAALGALSSSLGCGDKKERVVVREEHSGPVYVERDDDDYEVEYDDDDDIEVEVHRTHVCSQGCHHHYYDGHRVIVLRGHRHGPGCGHYWGGSYWLVDRGPRRVIVPKRGRAVRTAHVCTRGCNHHYWNGGAYVELRGHRHGPGCGHAWNGTYWIVGGGPTKTVVPKAGRRIR